MPRRQYVRIENGVPVFPLARESPVLPAGRVGDLVRGPGGVVLGRLTSEPQGPTLVAPRTMMLSYMTSMVGGFARIGTSSINPHIEPVPFLLGGPDPADDDPSGVAEDFRLMHGEAPSEAPSALDQLLDDEDDPIPTG